ncbi:MAG TPA: hypothetical protein RMH99_04820 [Sandaracinaceae bacterium LLY-WYZ-13_1]|nr:hypothetical protein [Sandaracinaceae bacterium LLY-WYZ-13_1]
MKRLSAVMVCLALSLGAGCSEEPPSVEGVGQPVPPPRPRGRSDADRLYDHEGVPLESDERVAGLVLPRGLTAVEELSEERRHVYRSRVPSGPLLRYFGPRLTTAQVDRSGGGVTYADAAPRGVRGGVVRLDVSIRPSSSAEALVEIYERPPAPPEGTRIPADEIRRHLERMQEEQRE